ncbi:hypothetical protein C7974DRAFT_475756 [Boeremia exigua]|uniref:uncharacterized protein n=1 Tax=Boeremia exigua TaxID=749465 RepID=UPI001E8EC4DE|nr:uncharacterized protein C7974DRAFT_475756 [Boeremia exigua]KAH6613876.1 hypothetical protein C7974DRAFT_475756 [Boeremia exigua]
MFEIKAIGRRRIKKSFSIDWIDVYDLDVSTGEWTAVEGTTYYSADTTLSGAAYHQEAPFASNGTIATNLSGNTSTITFEVTDAGGEQWVSFYYQNTDDMGFGDAPYGSPDRIGGIWILRHYGWVEVNNDPSTRRQLSMKDTHKGIIMASPLALKLTQGLNNITLGGLSNGNGTKAADVDRIVVYPLEQTDAGNVSATPKRTATPAKFTGGTSRFATSPSVLVALIAASLFL